MHYRPKLKHIQNQVQENVKRMMSEQLYAPSIGLSNHGKTHSNHPLAKPNFIASCSAFGPKVCLTSFMDCRSFWNLAQSKCSNESVTALIRKTIFVIVTCFKVPLNSLCLQGIGVVVRIAAMTTESVYRFLQHQLAGMEPLLGVSLYCWKSAMKIICLVEVPVTIKWSRFFTFMWKLQEIMLRIWMVRYKTFLDAQGCKILQEHGGFFLICLRYVHEYYVAKLFHWLGHKNESIFSICYNSQFL